MPRPRGHSSQQSQSAQQAHKCRHCDAPFASRTLKMSHEAHCPRDPRRLRPPWWVSPPDPLHPCQFCGLADLNPNQYRLHLRDCSQKPNSPVMLPASTCRACLQVVAMGDWYRHKLDRCFGVYHIPGNNNDPNTQAQGQGSFNTPYSQPQLLEPPYAGPYDNSPYATQQGARMPEQGEGPLPPPVQQASASYGGAYVPQQWFP